jgi:DNA-binding GntR family transcriptional regulator
LEKGRYPLYVNIYDSLLKEIESGKYQIGDQLPNENELASSFNVSRNTLRQALLLLLEDGIITNRQGKGTFVLMNKRPNWESMDKLSDLLYKLSNEEVDVVETKIEIRKISPRHQKIFNLDTSNLLVLLEIVYKVGGKPIGCALVFIPYNTFAKSNVPLDDMDKVYGFYQSLIASNGMVAESVLRIVYARDPVTVLLNVTEQYQMIMLDEILRAPNGNVAMTQKLFFIPDEYNFSLVRRNGRFGGK